ncbi:MAG TPA: LPD7 domain-containing protein [Bryobacteraceae bacterium]
MLTANTTPNAKSGHTSRRWPGFFSHAARLIIGSAQTRPFTDDELEEIERLWSILIKRFEIPATSIERAEDHIAIILPKDGRVTIDHTGITLDDNVASSDDRAIRASLEYFKRQYPASAMQLEGDDDFKLRVWVHAQTMGLTIQGYRPPVEKIETLNVTAEFSPRLSEREEALMTTWLSQKSRGESARYQPTRAQLGALRVSVNLSVPSARAAINRAPAKEHPSI